jgi:signal transduction histidine kinase
LQFAAPISALSTTELRPLADALAEFVARLRRAFETEQRFISDAAHELKTAVAVARSSIQVLGMKTRSAEEYREGLERILEDNQRTEDLVASMLTLARFNEAGTDAREEIDLGEETARIAKYLLPFAESRGVSLRSAGDSFHAPIRMSRQDFETLVSNLVMNAVEHSAPGSEVRTEVRVEGSKAVLEVHDSGEGIAAENLPHVFERFFREDPSRSRETGGAGLGLSICRSIVESAGGTIDIRSEKGKGTVVTVHFDLLNRQKA